MRKNTVVIIDCMQINVCVLEKNIVYKRRAGLKLQKERAVSRCAFLFPLNSSRNSCRPWESVCVEGVCVSAHIQGSDWGKSYFGFQMVNAA